MADRYPYRAERTGARDNHGPARASEGDPLAELARLIGQTDPNALPGRAAAPQPQRANYQQPHQPQQHHQDQDADYQDPRYQDQHYHDQHAHDQHAEPADPEPAQPSWMRAAASSSWQQQPAPTVHPAAPEHQHYAHEDEYSDTPAFLRTARQHDHTRYDDVLYDQNSQNATHPRYADEQYQDGYQDQSDPNAYPSFYSDGAQDEEQPRRRRGGLMTVLAVVLLAFVGTAAAYGYRSFTGSPRSGDPPVIKAEPGANKIVPPTQTTDATGKIVDRIGGNGNGQERVISREEQPIDMNSRAGTTRSIFPQPNLSPPPQVAAAQAPQAAGPNGALGDEPKRVRTYAIRPDQPDAVPQGSAPAPRAPTQARAQAPTPAANAPVSLAPGATPAPTRTQTAAATPAPAPAPSAATGGYMVQITSQRSEADAQASYRAVQLKYPDVLSSHQPSIRRADLGEKGIYYRALIGPFTAAEEAAKLCTSLKSAGGACVVQRN
jgi:SPOR domain